MSSLIFEKDVSTLYAQVKEKNAIIVLHIYERNIYFGQPSFLGRYRTQVTDHRSQVTGHCFTDTERILNIH